MEKFCIREDKSRDKENTSKLIFKKENNIFFMIYSMMIQYIKLD